MVDLTTLEKYRDRDFERRYYGCNGDSGNGVFRVLVNQRSFHCIVSNGGGWDHVSVSPCNKKRTTCPTWEEMCAIKNMFFLPEECVIEYHPPRSDYVNDCETCLHLWRPSDGKIPMPPTEFV